jgi:hypothetical protein
MDACFGGSPNRGFLERGMAPENHPGLLRRREGGTDPSDVPDKIHICQMGGLKARRASPKVAKAKEKPRAGPKPKEAKANPKVEKARHSPTGNRKGGHRPQR